VAASTELFERRNWKGAGDRFSAALTLYARLSPCDDVRCSRDELATAHQNHVINWITADDPVRARAALASAEAAGFRFPELKREIVDRSRFEP